MDLLRQIFRVLDLTQPFDLVFWAACLLAFFSFLRKSNLFFDKSNPAYLKRHDVSFLEQGATLKIQRTKTIQHGERPLVVPIPHIAGSPLCPSAALLLVYRMVAAPVQAPLLAYPTPTGPRALSYRTFVNHLKFVLSSLGVDPSQYAGHYFQRGEGGS